MIPNQWYAIACSNDLKKAPLGVRRMGENLVLFRDRYGRARCLKDRCPHKGARLSLGKLKGDSIECPYHGFRFDGRGECTLVPSLGEGKRAPGGMCTAAYSVSERYGYVWLWWGEARDEAELPPIPMFDGFKHYTGYTNQYGWEAPVHWTRYVESVCEVYHVPFVHRGSVLNIWDPKGTRVDDFVCQVEGNHIKSDFVLRADDERSSEETLHSLLPWRRGWRLQVEVLMPNLVLVANDVFDVVLMATPVDEERTWVTVSYQEPKRPLLLPLVNSRRPDFLRKLGPWLMCRLERYVQQSKDMRVMKDQTPRVSHVGANRFIALDAVNSHWLKLRDKLTQEATQSQPSAENRHKLPLAAQVN